jgi:hypothetical protein
MLAGFVKHAGERKKDSPSSKYESILSEANLNLGGAAKILMDDFGIKDKSELREAHIALIQETSRLQNRQQ